MQKFWNKRAYSSPWIFSGLKSWKRLMSAGLYQDRAIVAPSKPLMWTSLLFPRLQTPKTSKITPEHFRGLKTSLLSISQIFFINSNILVGDEALDFWNTALKKKSHDATEVGSGMTKTKLAVPAWALGEQPPGWCLWCFLPTTWTASGPPWRRCWSARPAIRRSPLSSDRLYTNGHPVGRRRPLGAL